MHYMLSHHFQVSLTNNQCKFYCIFYIEMLLEKDHFPQRIKHDFLAKHQSGRFVYKPMDT